MAKKQVEELTIEEKLNNALIPVDKQPYKIPQNWCWVYLTSIIDIEGGTQPSKKEFIKEPKEGYIRLIQIRDFSSNAYKVYIPMTSQRKYFTENDILIARYGASIGKICIGLSGAYNVALAKTIFSEKVLFRRFVFWSLKSDNFQKQLPYISRTAQAGFNKKDLSNFPFPLPPLAEQERIANKLDNYISKLDEAKEKLKKVVDTYNYRKNLILHRAFTGQLTKKWRKENKFELDDDIKKQAITKDSILPDEYLYEIPENWRWIRLADVISISKETTDDFLDKTKKYIGLENIEKNGGINSVGDISEVKSLKNVFHKGQILYGKLRPYLNKHDIANFEGVCSTDILVLDSNRNTINTFVNYYLSNIYFIDYVVYNSRGINLPRITTKILLNASFPLPPLEEQKEIVKILDSVLSKEKQVKEIAEKEIERVEDLKKNLLTRAFGGILGTNDPNEENSIELLKTVL